ncbi:hypothetical protein CBL_12779 [Carabus blaptoides fortunei]
MNLFNWQFSKEVQPELEKFMHVVDNKQKSEECYNFKLFKEIFPELNSGQVVNHKTDVIDDADVIVIDDGDDEVNKQNTTNDNDALLNATLANLTCIESEVKITRTDLQNFIAYVEESLDVENVLLRDTDLHRLATEYNQDELECIFTSVGGSLSDQGLLNMSRSVCGYTGPNKDYLAKQFFRIVLLKKFTSTDPTSILTSMLKEISEVYMDLARNGLLIPLFVRDCPLWHQTGINVLSEVDAQYLLRDLLYSCSKLEVWHLSTIYAMLSQKTDEPVKRRLINLMAASAVTFSNEKQFMRLFTTLVQKLGKGYGDQKEVLYGIVQRNKTLLRTSAHKILNEWANTEQYSG